MSGKKRKRLLLHDLAVALNACEKAGIRPKLKHGIVFTDAGYVMPVGDRWVSRKLKSKLLAQSYLLCYIRDSGICVFSCGYQVRDSSGKYFGTVPEVPEAVVAVTA